MKHASSTRLRWLVPTLALVLLAVQALTFLAWTKVDGKVKTDYETYLSIFVAKQKNQIDSFRISMDIESLQTSGNTFCTYLVDDNGTVFLDHRGYTHCRLFKFTELSFKFRSQRTIWTLKTISQLRVYVFLTFALIHAALLFFGVALIYSLSQKLRQQFLIEYERQKILNQVSHDLASPLAALHSTGQQLKNSTIMELVDRVRSIINDIQAPESASVTDCSVPIVFCKILEQKFLEFGAHLDATLVHDMQIGQTFVHFPEHELARIFSNLINNSYEAFQAPKSQLKIQLRLIQAPGELTVTFSDNGPGFPERIIDSFMRDEQASTKDVDRGQGLQHLRRISRSFGAEVKISNAGGGCTVIRFKLSARPPIKNFISQSHILSLTSLKSSHLLDGFVRTPRRIFLVEDDKYVANAWRLRCQEVAIPFTWYKTFAEFYQQAPAELSELDYVFVDLNIDDESGEPHLPRIRSLGDFQLWVASGESQLSQTTLAIIDGSLGKLPPI